MTAATVPIPLKTGCISDGAFAAVGRGAMCFAPWIADTDDCLGDAQMSLLARYELLLRAERKERRGDLDARQEELLRARMTPIDPGAAARGRR